MILKTRPEGASISAAMCLFWGWKNTQDGIHSGIRTAEWSQSGAPRPQTVSIRARLEKKAD